MNRAARVLAPAAVAVAVVALPGIAWASFSGTASASLRASTHVLGAPSDVTTVDCPGNGKADRFITVDWTPSADALVTGYLVTLTADHGTDLTVPVAGRTTHELIQDVAHKTSYTVTVAATYGNWTSTPTAAPGAANC